MAKGKDDSSQVAKYLGEIYSLTLLARKFETSNCDTNSKNFAEKSPKFRTANPEEE